MLELPERPGPRPRTSEGIPHRQIDQQPSAELFGQLAHWLCHWPGTEPGASLVSVPGARAMFLCAGRAANTRYGFIRAREIAHLHPPGDGSMHVALAPDDMAQVLRRGWGEPHPLTRTGEVLPTIALIFAPRDDRELEVVRMILAASFANATAVIDQPINA